MTVSGRRAFLCGFRVSACCAATVHRICTSGQPDEFACQRCGRTHASNCEPESRR